MYIYIFPADNVKVVLMDKDRDKTSECYGAVYIKVNNETSPVCASTWTKENAEVVCKELNCGNVSFHCGERQKKKKKGAKC